MKKFIVIGVIALSLFPTIAWGTFDQNLKYGNKGEQVRELQEFLTDQGVYAGPISGNFYSLTLQAVKKFQVQNGIKPASGYFGSLTRGKANEILSKDLEDSDKEVTAEPEKVAPKFSFPVFIPYNAPQPAAEPTPIVTQPKILSMPEPVISQPVLEPVGAAEQPAQPVSQAKLEIFNPIWIKGFHPGKQYKAALEVVDETNYVYIGLVVTNEKNENDRTPVVEITATDSKQNKTLNGTGTVLSLPIEGFPAGTYYYGFNYEFHEAGNHTITFKTLGMEKSLTVQDVK